MSCQLTSVVEGMSPTQVPIFSKGHEEARDTSK
ncbi:unnamed protein product [Chondrus crispus]|uniref:Uncharacterized protein n=1 Tax=Chondrus crispus TaxID=2769 RepID=R7QMY0_CHOCR|nr:unnamed protein product [Chondrus crispus]CDF39123.1 unnamed protein product [Chondrus crispus]|eukprot:XP_005719034.1 unnamed protein product [Chondrus crispus]